MIVLSRSMNESITIGSDMLARVLQFRDAALDLAFVRRSIKSDFSPPLAARLGDAAGRISVEVRTMGLDDVFDFEPGVKIAIVDLGRLNWPGTDPIHWKVRIGITAPRELSVHRKEIFSSIPREYGGPDEPWPAEWD